MARKTYAIVVSELPAGSGREVLYRMDTEDYRYRTDNYRHLAYVVGQEKGTVVSPYNGRKVRVLHADNGKSYHQFSDWSVKEAV